jgi:two-component system response regulator DegU
MIVDDSKAFRDAVSHLLSKNPLYQVVAEAENGKLAYEMFEKYNPDVILMDIEMPILNGIEATRKILNINSSIKIIAVTAYKEKIYMSDIEDIGFSSFVYKNNVYEQLEEAISKSMTNNTC